MEHQVSQRIAALISNTPLITIAKVNTLLMTHLLALNEIVASMDIHGKTVDNMKKLLLSLLMFSSVALAQEDVTGTYQVGFSQTSVQGALIACDLSYKAVTKSSLYEQDATYGVVGNIGVGVNSSRKELFGILKTTVTKLDLKSAKGSSVKKKPYFAYLQAPNGINDAKSFNKSGDTDPPAGLFSIFDFAGSYVDVFTQLLETKKVSVVFNLAKNGADIVVPIDLTVKTMDANGKRIYSSQALEDYIACSRGLFKEVLANNGVKK